MTYKLDEPRSPAWRARNDMRRGRKGKAGSRGRDAVGCAGRGTRASRLRDWGIQTEAYSADSLLCSPWGSPCCSRLMRS